MLRLDTMSIERILNDESQPPAPIVGGGVLLEKTLLMVIGQPKTRKTFLTLNLAISISQGRSFSIFHIPAPRRVLVLSAEGGYFPMRSRLKKMYKAKGLTANANLEVCFRANLNLTDDRDFMALREKIRRLQTEVLVIDPFVRFHNASENGADEMAGVFGGIRTLIEEDNLSVILVHHSGKSDDHGGRGSSTIEGEYDSRIHISAANDADVHMLEFEMRHVETPEPASVRFNGDTGWFEEGQLDERQMTVKRAISSMAPEGRNKAGLVKALDSMGVPLSTAYRWADDAIKNGLLGPLDGPSSDASGSHFPVSQ